MDFQADTEESAVKSLVERYKSYQQQEQQFRQYQPYLQSYLQHAGPFAQWLRSVHGQAGQPPAPQQPQGPQEQKPWWSDHWKAPDYNPSWLQQVTQDEKGNLIPIPGAPPDIVQKIADYRQFRQEQAERLMQNPYQFFEPLVQQAVQQARQESERVIREQLSQQRDIAMSTQFVQQNSRWLYELDPQGQTMIQSVYNPMSGSMVQTPVLSQWGRMLYQAVQEESQKQQQRGYFDQEEQQRNAMMRVQNQYMLNLLQQGAQPNQQPAQAPPQTLSPQQQSNQDFLKQNNPPAQQPPSGQGTRPARRKIGRNGLGAALAERFKQTGITDDSIKNDFLKGR
jgi:hypothetical protein